MTPETFLENFGHLVEALNGLQKLRDLILQLAVRGKLVEQDPGDEPARCYLSRLAGQKEQILKINKVKKPKSLPPIQDNEIAHNIPNSWEWIRLGEIVTKIGSGSTPRGGRKAYVDEGVKFLRSQNVWNDGLRLDNVAFIPKETHNKMGGTHVQPGDILLNITGASIGRCSLVPDDFDEANVSQHVSIIRAVDKECRHYIHLSIISPYFYMEIMNKQVGMSREGISKTKLMYFPIPLPPLAEGHRIAAKVDQLMALCDELEERQQKKARVNARLNAAALDKLLTADRPEEFQEHWDRIRDNFDLLYRNPDNVKLLRQAVLQLAVMGKLVPQEPNDEPASVIVESAKAAKQELIDTKIFRKQKSVAPLELGDFPFAAPAGWVWSRFDEVAAISGGVTKGRKLTGRKTAHYPYLRVANVQRGFLDLSVIKEIEIPVDELDKYALRRGDILLTEGGDWDKLGRGAIWSGEISNCLHQNHVFRARSMSIDLAPEWIVSYTNSAFGRRYFESASKQTTNLASINMTQLRHCPIPIPPKAEQEMILRTLDHFMSLCDSLEAALIQSQTQAEKLFDSIVSNLLNGDGSTTDQGNQATIH